MKQARLDAARLPPGKSKKKRVITKNELRVRGQLRGEEGRMLREFANAIRAFYRLEPLYHTGQTKRRGYGESTDIGQIQKWSLYFDMGGARQVR